MLNHQLKLKCSCGFEEVLIPEMEENGLQIYIGFSEETPTEASKLVLDCKECGTKLSLEVVREIKKEEDVPEEIRNEG
jgi:hypothetical protein